MKKMIPLIALLILLTGCDSFANYELSYDTNDFIFEVNGQEPDYTSILSSEYDLDIDDSEVDYSMVGTYILNVFVENNTTIKHYEIPVVIEDTIAPEIIIPDDFQTYYLPNEEIDISTITTSDNSNQDVIFTSNFHELDNTEENIFHFILTAIDQTGNLATTSIELHIREIELPSIEVVVSNVTDSRFTINFVKEDPRAYIIEEKYYVTSDSQAIQAGIVPSEDVITIKDLLQATTYMFKYEIKYRIPGEDDTHIMTHTIMITTEELFTPIVTLDGLNSTSDSIGFDLSVIDPDQRVDDFIINLVQDGQVIDSVSYSESLTGFSNLLSNTEYEINILVTYDINDGNGTQTIHISETITTSE
jgi:hypothetical protein